MSALEKNLEVLASTPDEDLGPARTGEESWEAPRNSHGDWTFLRQYERVPEVPVITREEPQVPRHNSKKSKRFSPQLEMRPFSAVLSREKSQFPSWALKGSLKLLLQLKKFPDIPVSTRKEQRGSCHNSKSPVFRSSSRDECPFPWFFWKDMPAFLTHLKRSQSQLEPGEELKSHATRVQPRLVPGYPKRGWLSQRVI